MLEAAQKYWTKSKYHNAKWTEERENVHKVGGKPNQPYKCRDLEKCVILLEAAQKYCYESEYHNAKWILLSCKTHLCSPVEGLGASRSKSDSFIKTEFKKPSKMAYFQQVKDNILRNLDLRPSCIKSNKDGDQIRPSVKTVARVLETKLLLDKRCKMLKLNTKVKLSKF